MLAVFFLILLIIQLKLWLCVFIPENSALHREGVSLSFLSFPSLAGNPLGGGM